MRVEFQIGPPFPSPVVESLSREPNVYPIVNTAIYVFGIALVEISVTVQVIVPLTIIPPLVSWVHVGAGVSRRQKIRSEL